MDDIGKSNERLNKIEFLISYFQKVWSTSIKHKDNINIFNICELFAKTFKFFLKDNSFDFSTPLPYGIIQNIHHSSNHSEIYEMLKYLLDITSKYEIWWNNGKHQFICDLYDLLHDTTSIKQSDIHKRLYRYRLLFDYCMKFSDQKPFKDIFHHIISLNDNETSHIETTTFKNVSSQRYVMILTCNEIKQILNEKHFTNPSQECIVYILPYLHDKCFEFLFNKINPNAELANPLLIELNVKLDQIYSLVETC